MFRFSSRPIRLGIILTLVWVITATLIPPALVSGAPQARYLSVHITTQRFAHGLMLYRSDTGAIWLLSDSGQAYQFPSLTYGNLPDNPIPSGFRLLRPINGFGKVWGNYAWVRTVLGWPLLPEFGHTSQIVASGPSLYLTQFNDQIIEIVSGTWHYVSSLPSDQPQTPVIHSFTTSSTSASPGSTVTLNWQITGANAADVFVWDSANNLVYAEYGLSLTGSTSFVMPAYEQKHVRAVVWANTGTSAGWNPTDFGANSVTNQIIITVTTQGPHTDYTRAAFQQYINGFMIWRADNGMILVFLGAQSGQVYTFSVGTYGSLPNNPFLAPIGYITPINGFGKVWGNHDWVRNSLNWATQPEAGYDMTIETDGTQNTAVYLLPSGQKVVITGGHTWNLQ